MIDIHIHSKFSFDSSESPENYIERALSEGIEVLGFSEHYDYDAYLDGADITLCDLQKYRQNIINLRKKYSGIDILFGIEFGYRDKAVEQYERLCAEYDFDYVINSVHTLAGRGDCFDKSFFEGLTTRQAFENYLCAVLESVKSPIDYQIVGHIGYVARYCGFKDAKIPYGDYPDLFDEILKEIIKRDKCLEINTSVGRSACEFLPDCDVIERYVSLGGRKLSFGSDAHSAQNYRKEEDKLRVYLKSIGIEQLYYYNRRKPVAYKI